MVAFYHLIYATATRVYFTRAVSTFFQFLGGTKGNGLNFNKGNNNNNGNRRN